MNGKLYCLAPVFACMVFSLRAADDAQLAAIKAADDERVAAILESAKTGEAAKARLDAIFSDDLRYTHSSGKVDTKASYMDTLINKKTKYLVYEYEERHFSLAAPTIGLLATRVHIKSENAEGVIDNNILSILAVFREEKGKWRFLAWQSCKVQAVK